MTKLDNRWFTYFLDHARRSAEMSTDPNTKVGCCIFDEDEKLVIATGWNGLARQVRHTEERQSRPLKYSLVSHSEISAIANCARAGRSTLGKSLIVTPLCPCSLCAAAIINAGIKRVYSPPADFEHKQYGESFKLSIEQFEEAGVEVVFYENV